MSLLVCTFGAAATFTMLLISTVVADMVSEEVRDRLDKIPKALVRMAVRFGPADQREEMLEEWIGELHFVLRGAEGRPVTRLWRGLKFSITLPIAARRTAPRPQVATTTAAAAIAPPPSDPDQSSTLASNLNRLPWSSDLGRDAYGQSKDVWLTTEHGANRVHLELWSLAFIERLMTTWAKRPDGGQCPVCMNAPRLRS